MKQLLHIKNAALILISILLLINCNQNVETPVYNPELVFPNSFRINVEPYNYYDSATQQTFYVLGDSAIVTDTVSSTPIFEWDKTLTSLVTVVISTRALVVNNGTIQNIEDIIWQWQPGMEKGENGKVAYSEGLGVNNKNILSQTQPLPLENGLYYWAVYGWESSGREIFYSTLPLMIYVK